MPSSGFSLIDQTVQETNQWLNEISEELGNPDKQIAYHALRGVLTALGDRMLPEKALHLSSQLPILIRGIFFEGYHLLGKPENYEDQNVFLSRVSTDLHVAGGTNSEAATRAVLSVLTRHIDRGEATQIKELLPKSLRNLWRNGNH